MIAGLAFWLALATYRFNLAKSRRDLFISIHEKLIDPEVQRGREILYTKVKHLESAGALKRDEFESVNRSLALYDTLAMYALNGDVIESHVTETWGPTMHRAAGKVRKFIAYRSIRDGYEPWPHLTELLGKLDERPPVNPLTKESPVGLRG